MDSKTLPPELVARIETFKNILGACEPTSLAETINNFSLDENPEREILVWEKIAEKFKTYLAEHPTENETVRREIFAVLMGASMGIVNWDTIKNLSEEEVKEIIGLYIGMNVN